MSDATYNSSRYNGHCTQSYIVACKIGIYTTHECASIMQEHAYASYLHFSSVIQIGHDQSYVLDKLVILIWFLLLSKHLEANTCILFLVRYQHSLFPANVACRVVISEYALPFICNHKYYFRHFLKINSCDRQIKIGY